jgi:hypothetical protein
VTPEQVDKWEREAASGRDGSRFAAYQLKRWRDWKEGRSPDPPPAEPSYVKTYQPPQGHAPHPTSSPRFTNGPPRDRRVSSELTAQLFALGKPDGPSPDTLAVRFARYLGDEKQETIDYYKAVLTAGAEGRISPDRIAGAFKTVEAKGRDRPKFFSTLTGEMFPKTSSGRRMKTPAGSP